MSKVLAKVIRERTKRVQIQRKEVKAFLFSDDMVPYLKDSYDAMKRLRLDTYFQQRSGIQINVETSVAFL